MKGVQHPLLMAMKRAWSMPALRTSRDRLVTALEDEQSTQADLVAAVESDVGLVAGLLRQANKEPRAKIATVADAIDSLGPAGMKRLVNGMDTYDFFERLARWRLPPERFRLHALAVALIADLIAREVGHPRRDELVVAALLHDVGKVVMAAAYPDYAQQTLDSERTADQRARLERDQHGVDHSLIGGVVLRRWRLPKAIAEVVERHHDPDATGGAGILRLADMLAHHERGAATRPADLEQAAAGVGVSGSKLRALVYHLPDRGEAGARSPTDSPLSGQEREVIRGLAASKLYKEIARDLDIAPSTVRSHMHNAYPKLGATGRAQAVLVATRRGWL